MEKEVNLVCLFCGLEYSTFDQLEEHMEIHNELSQQVKKEFLSDIRRSILKVQNQIQKQQQKLRNQKTNSFSDYKTNILRILEELSANKDIIKEIESSKSVGQIKAFLTFNKKVRQYHHYFDSIQLNYFVSKTKKATKKNIRKACYDKTENSIHAISTRMRN